MGFLRKPKVLVIILLLLGSLVLSQTLLRFPFPPISIKPEPIAKELISSWDLTNTIISAWVGMSVLLLLAYLTTRKARLVPSGLQNFVEAVIEWLYGLVENIAGRKNGRKFFPLVATIFLFVIVNNWISLVPGFGTFGKLEPAHEVIEHVIEEKADDAGISLHDAEAQFKEILSLSEEERASPPSHLAVGLSIFQELEDIDLHLFDNVGPFQVLPLSLHDQAISGVEYVEKKEHNELPQGKEIGWLIPYFRNANTALNTTLALALIAMFMVEFWGVQTLGFFKYGGKFFNPRGFLDFFVGVLEGISEFAKIISFTFRLFGNMFAGEILLFVMMFLVPLTLAVPFYGLELFVGFIQAVIFAFLTLIFAVIAVSAHNGHGEDEHGLESQQTKAEEE